jgi:hypothetical protein
MRRICYLFIFLLLSGCASVNKSSFQNLSSSYREVVEQYSNENILINIVRTSKNMPMSFLDIPTVVGTGSVQANVSASGNYASAKPSSLAGFFSAGTTGEANAGLGMSVNNGFTFTQASLDNAEFMGAFLKDIPLDTIVFQGTETNMPRSVIFSLLFDSIELKSSNNHQMHVWRNNPTDGHEYAKFQELLYLLVDLGLTVERKQIKVPLGPTMSSEELSKTFGAWSTLFANDKDNLMSLEPVENTKNYQLSKKQFVTKACINKQRALEIVGPGIISPLAFCTDSISMPRVIQDHSELTNRLYVLFPNAQDITFALKLRSVGNVFDFLGNVMGEQYQKPSNVISIKTPKSMFKGKANELPLFYVYKNTPIPNPAYSVNYKGDTYTIADDNLTYTKPVLEFMSSLITLSKIPGAVPASPAVLVR